MSVCREVALKVKENERARAKADEVQQDGGRHGLPF